MSKKNAPSKEVTRFLDDLAHPLRKEIELLRTTILQADGRLAENVKWNGPNYSVGDDDRLTMKIQPPKQIQLIFHRGAKVQTQPKNKLIDDASGLLTWKTNDRALATFKNKADIESATPALKSAVKKWIDAAS